MKETYKPSSTDTALGVLIGVSVVASALCLVFLMVAVGRRSMNTAPPWIYLILASPLISVGALLIRRWYKERKSGSALPPVTSAKEPADAHQRILEDDWFTCKDCDEDAVTACARCDVPLCASHTPYCTNCQADYWVRFTQRMTWTKASIAGSVVAAAIVSSWYIGIVTLFAVPIGIFVLFIGIGGGDPPAGGTYYARGPGRH